MVFVMGLTSVVWWFCVAVVFAACRVAGRADAGEPVYAARKRGAQPRPALRTGEAGLTSVHTSWKEAARDRCAPTGAPVRRLRSGYGGLRPHLGRGTYSHP